MAFNGSGVFQRVRNWVADATAGIKIRADYHDAEDDGFAAGLSNCITKDGQTLITQNIPFNSKRITGLADPVNPQDAATKASIPSLVSGVSLPVTGGTITGDLTVSGILTATTINGTTVTTTNLNVTGSSIFNQTGTVINSGTGGPFMIQSTGQAMITLHNQGSFAGNLGFIGADLYMGGWSFGAGVQHRILSSKDAIYAGIPISGNPSVTDASHSQKCIIGTGGVTINGPAHPDGTCITFYANGGSLVVANNETMFWYSPSGGVAGNRTLGDRGIATALKIGGGHWVIGGSGLT